MTVEIDGLLAFDILESEYHPPQPRILRLGMGDDFVVSFAGDVIEREVRGRLQCVDIAISLAKGGSLELGEISEPADTQCADRFVPRVNDDMGGLIIVAIEGLLRFDA